MNRAWRPVLWILAAVAAVHLGLAWRFPGLAAASARGGLRGFGQILAILPAVLVLLALFDAWVPRAVVERSLGPGSGLRGVAFALLLGTAAAGPIYAAFPLGLSLREKGARTANLVIFLGAWATIKAPMLLLESAYLGPRFTLIRFVLTVPGILGCGFFMERLERRSARQVGR